MTWMSAFLMLALVFNPAAARSLPSEGQDRLERLAAQGQIQENAPVKAVSTIDIKASPERVWQILTGVDQWSEWQATVSASHLDGALKPGTTFTWTNGGAAIKSRIALVQRTERIGWTGTAYKARAIHIWSLQPSPGGGTRVSTSESMDGFLLTIFYSSRDLAKSHEIWLQALKHRAEE